MTAPDSCEHPQANYMIGASCCHSMKPRHERQGQWLLPCENDSDDMAFFPNGNRVRTDRQALCEGGVTGLRRYCSDSLPDWTGPADVFIIRPRHWGVAALLREEACVNTLAGSGMAQAVFPPGKTFDHTTSHMAGEVAWSFVFSGLWYCHGIPSRLDGYRRPR